MAGLIKAQASRESRITGASSSALEKLFCGFQNFGHGGHPLEKVVTARPSRCNCPFLLRRPQGHARVCRSSRACVVQPP